MHREPVLIRSSIRGIGVVHASDLEIKYICVCTFNVAIGYQKLCTRVSDTFPAGTFTFTDTKLSLVLLGFVRFICRDHF